MLYALARSGVEPELRLSYTVRDPEAVKNELLDRAVSDAKAKAAVLARAGGVVLGEIRHIDYSWGELGLEVRPTDRMLMSANGVSAKRSLDLDIEPDDIEASDTVSVVWEIG